MDKKKMGIIGVLAIMLIGLLAITGCTSEPVVPDAAPEPTAPVVVPEPQPVVTETVTEDVVVEEVVAEAPIEEVVVEVVEEVVEVEELSALFESFTEDELKLGSSVVLKELLFKEEVEFEDKDYTVKTYLMTTSGLKIAYSLVDDKDFESEPALVYSKNSIAFFVMIRDNFDFTKVNNSRPLDIDVLGEKLTIIDASSSSLELMHGNEAYVQEGNEFEGIKLEMVGYDAVVLRCVADNEVATVEGDGTETVKLCGKKVRVSDLFYREDGNAAAFLRVGEDIYETVRDGDVFIEDEEGEDVWTWVIDTEENVIGFEYALKATKADEAVLVPEDSLDLLGLATMSFDWDSEPEYSEFELSFDEFDLGEDFENVLVFEGNFAHGDEEEVSKVLWNGTAFWAKNDENAWTAVEDVIFADAELALEPHEFEEGLVCFADVCIEADIATETLTEVWVATPSEESMEPLSEVDHDVLTAEGIVLEDVENSVEDNELNFRIPESTLELAVSFA